MKVEKIEEKIIKTSRNVYKPFARISLFVVFFWFGILKVLDLSPATPLVGELFNATLSFISFKTFLICFGLFEMLIGILFLIRGAERIVMPLLLVHMFTTFLPLVLLRETTWNGFLAPTLEGQYIIKNLVILALSLVIVAHLKFFHEKGKENF